MFRLNNTNVDLPISEDKNSIGSRRLVAITKFLESVVQDVIFFFVLSCITILLIFGLLMALGSLARLQGYHNTVRAIPVKIAVPNSFPKCAWPKEWCHFFSDFHNKVDQMEPF